MEKSFKFDAVFLERYKKMNDEKIVSSLNNILELELAGVVKYTHYAFMVQGPYRLSIVEWLRAQAQESLMHAEAVGEHITSLGEHPTLKISDILETHKHSTEDILNECLEHERTAIKAYYDLLHSVKDARTQIASEEMHEAELKKILRDNF